MSEKKLLSQKKDEKEKRTAEKYSNFQNNKSTNPIDSRTLSYNGYLFGNVLNAVNMSLEYSKGLKELTPSKIEEAKRFNRVFFNGEYPLYLCNYFSVPSLDTAEAVKKIYDYQKSKASNPKNIDGKLGKNTIDRLRSEGVYPGGAYFDMKDAEEKRSSEKENKPPVENQSTGEGMDIIHQENMYGVKDDPKKRAIHMDPPLKEVVPGTEMTYKFFIRPDLFLTDGNVKCNWFCQYDLTNIPEAIQKMYNMKKHMFNGKAGYIEVGSSERNWKFRVPRWPGAYRIYCRVQYSDTTTKYYFYEQVVVDAVKNADKVYDTYGSMQLQPDVYLAQLEIQKAVLSKSSLESDKKKLEKLKEVIEEFKKKVNIDTVTTGKYSGFKNRTISAMLIPKERPIPIALQLFLQPLEDGSWKIVDATNPSSMREYIGDSKASSGNLKEIRIAVNSAWSNFIKDNKYPEGRIVADRPRGYGYKKGSRWNERSTGSITLAGFLSGLGSVLGGIGMAALFVPLPGARVAGAGLLTASAAAEATSISMRMYDRYEHGVLKWDTDTKLDLLGLAGSLAAGTGSFISIGSKLGRMGNLSKAFILSEGVELGTDAASTVVLSSVYLTEIEAVREKLRKGMISGEECTKEIRGILIKASMSGGMLLLNIKNAKSVLKDIDFKNGIKKIDKIADADASLEERVRAYERYGSNNKWHVRNKTKVINIKSGNYIELGTNVFKWGNSKSKKTYGHTFLDHSVTVDSQKLFNRARVKKQVGQWLDDKAAAKFLADFARDNKPGIYLHVPMPEDVPGRVFLKDGRIINNPDNVVIIIRKDGSIKTAYPQSIKYAY